MIPERKYYKDVPLPRYGLAAEFVADMYERMLVDKSKEGQAEFYSSIPGKAIYIMKVFLAQQEYRRKYEEIDYFSSTGFFDLRSLEKKGDKTLPFWVGNQFVLTLNKDDLTVTMHAPPISKSDDPKNPVYEPLLQLGDSRSTGVKGPLLYAGTEWETIPDTPTNIAVNRILSTTSDYYFNLLKATAHIARKGDMQTYDKENFMDLPPLDGSGRYLIESFSEYSKLLRNRYFIGETVGNGSRTTVFNPKIAVARGILPEKITSGSSVSFQPRGR